MTNTIWLRQESRATERRTPLLPKGAKALLNMGYYVIVERSKKRIMSDHEYEAIGCHMSEAGSWGNAPKGSIILGLKELPAKPALLRNTHIYFAHAFKEQNNWQSLISRFTKGGGQLLDLEYMVNQDGKRVAAFGFWAGYIGAALALIHWNDQQSGKIRYLDNELRPYDNAPHLNKTLKSTKLSHKNPKVLIIGAGGKSGKGALNLLNQHGADITCWGRDKTAQIERDALLNHDILINCAFITEKVPAFLRREDLSQNARLSVISDVSCDPFSDYNPLPLYKAPTTWEKPYVTVRGLRDDKTVDIIAIDNLPSLLPYESSEEFSALLLPHLMTLKNKETDPVWVTARKSFDIAVRHMAHQQRQFDKIPHRSTR